MSLKSLACVSLAAVGLVFSATDAPAQSWWNPTNMFKPAYSTNYAAPMNCSNGVCRPVSNCPNGNCAVGNCATGNCPKMQCGPGGCFPANAYRNPGYVPTTNYRPAAPGYYETYRGPVNRTTNFRMPVNGRVGANPFYP